MNSSESHGYPRMVKTPQEIPISPTADLTFFLLLFLPHSSLSVLQLANGSVGGRRADLYAAGRSHEGSGCSPRTPALESDRGSPTRVLLFVWGCCEVGGKSSVRATGSEITPTRMHGTYREVGWSKGGG
jgi:hypothetical protein